MPAPGLMQASARLRSGVSSECDCLWTAFGFPACHFHCFGWDSRRWSAAWLWISYSPTGWMLHRDNVDLSSSRSGDRASVWPGSNPPRLTRYSQHWPRNWSSAIESKLRVQVTQRQKKERHIGDCHTVAPTSDFPGREFRDSSSSQAGYGDVDSAGDAFGGGEPASSADAARSGTDLAGG